MMNIGYFIAIIKKKISRNGREAIPNYLRKKGVSVGKRCNIWSDISAGESYLISIGDDVTISTRVQFITHDASIGKVLGKAVASDVCGKISIGDNCFIGANSILLYGVTLPANTIVAAGSVVTKSISEEKMIIGGNPARVISDWDSFAKKGKVKAYQIDGKSNKDKRAEILSNQDKLLKR